MDVWSDVAPPVSVETDLSGSLRATLGKMELALATLVDAIVWGDEKGRVQWCNTSFERLLGKTRLQILGVPLIDLLPLELGGKPLDPDTHPAALLLRFRSSTTGFYEFHQGGKDLVLEVFGTLAPMGDYGTSEVFVIRDVTEDRKAQQALEQAYAALKQTQQELIQSEKQAALGRFSFGLAHEIKNPLGIILGWAEFLERRTAPADSQTREAIDHIKHSVHRADAIVRGLLQFGRAAPLQVETIDVKEILEGALALLKNRLRLASIEIKSDPPPPPPLEVSVDRNQIQQVFFNILTNAAEAMPKGGTLAVRISRLADSFCSIEITDTGEGISREHRARIFEPFFTTKRNQGGIGLGLSVSKTIVENHRGSLHIESEPGRGTRIRVVLPLAVGL